MKKAADVLLTVFSIGILLGLLAGGVSAIFYLIALFVGGENATALCAWTFKTYLPWVIRITSVFAGIGLIAMYFTRQKALTVSNEDTTKVNSEGMEENKAE